ncbi:MAG TPA: hypothetical protein ENJ80_06645 [Gammaproteobacteria bacterium]|nr:hypothetical protein [Gammaproteobacteria bacterium]
MEVAKIVPQFFYDVIARVIPGTAAIIGASVAMGYDIVNITVAPFGGSTKLLNSSFFFVTMLFGYSYVAGHLINPLGDILRPLIEKLFPGQFHILRTEISTENGSLPENMRDLLAKETDMNDSCPVPDGTQAQNKGIYTSLLFIWADWLRLERPDVGARLVKLRAEYRMQIGLTVAATITLLLHVVSCLAYQYELNIILIVFSLCVVVLSSTGYAQSYGTFQWSVINNYYAAKCMPHPVPARQD